MDLTERKVSSETIFEGRIVRVTVDQAQLPDGKLAVREVVYHPGGVAILPLDEDNNVTLVRRRPGAERGDRTGGPGAYLPGTHFGLSRLL